MKPLLLAALVLTLAQVPGDPCPDCPQPDRPWMRGTEEKSCAPMAREGVLACACQHLCAPEIEETNGRRWDWRCQARCNPANCRCPHPCEED